MAIAYRGTVIAGRFHSLAARAVSGLWIAILSVALTSTAALARIATPADTIQTSPLKTRVWGFGDGGSGQPCVGGTVSHGIATGSDGFGYESASGRPIWPNRDPLGEPGFDSLHGLVSEGVFEFDFNQFNIPSADDSPLIEGNPYLGMRNSQGSYIDPDGRFAAPVIREIIKMLALAEAKRIARREAECAAIHATYKSFELQARKCTPGMSADEAAKNCALWSAVVAGRTLYLTKKCDYYLLGSIAKGSKKAEAGHKIALAQISQVMLRCCSYALPEVK